MRNDVFDKLFLSIHRYICSNEVSIIGEISTDDKATNRGKVEKPSCWCIFLGWCYHDPARAPIISLSLFQNSKLLQKDIIRVISHTANRTEGWKRTVPNKQLGPRPLHLCCVTRFGVNNKPFLDRVVLWKCLFCCGGGSSFSLVVSTITVTDNNY